jgi:CheY-specific phosphatase CheX
MPDTDVKWALATAMDSVLEQMFFVMDLAETETGGASSTSSLHARVRFAGEPSGWLDVEVEREAAMAMAADFLAVDAADLTAAQVQDVVLELANMLCGAALSRLEEGGLMRLSAPEALPGPETPDTPAAAARSVHVGTGVVTVRCYFETACPA